MKKIVVSLLLLVLFSCRPTDVIDAGYILEVFVGDATNFGVEGATVTLYANQLDFQNDVNPIATAQTNNKGIAIFKSLDIGTLAYIVNVEFFNQNNWEENKLVTFKLDEQYQSYKTKIKSSIANQIAGRFAKRWRQTGEFINNLVQDNCNTRTEQVFRRDWFIQIFNGTNCPDAGRQWGQDVWSVTSDNRGLIRGTPGGVSERRFAIIELTSTKLVCVETPIPGLSIRQEFVAMN